MLSILGVKLRNLVRSDMPYFPNSIRVSDALAYQALNRMVLILGEPSSGKTVWMAKHMVDYMKANPENGIVSIDIKGELTIEILRLILLEPSDIREKLIARLKYDKLGDEDYVLPMPEF